MNQCYMNSEVGEILGAFIGDGWIESRGNAIYITGSPSEDRAYYDKFLAPLFSKHFEKVKPKSFPYWGVYGIVSYKKRVIKETFSLGFQKGHKSTVAKIPDWVMNSENMSVVKAVIRGVFDTDGSFWCEKSRSKSSCEWKRTHNYHPEMRITSCSSVLLSQIRTLLDEIGIESNILQKAKKGVKCGRNIHDSFALNIRKIGQINKWFKIIGTNNPRHQTRHDVWKKLGHLPPYMDINERANVLDSIT